MRFPAVATLAILMAGCVTAADSSGSEPVSADRGAICNARPAQVLIGQKATTALGARALDLTGASNLRWGPPGAVFTMDFREDRVNVLYDQQMMVTQVRCG